MKKIVKLSLISMISTMLFLGSCGGTNNSGSKDASVLTIYKARPTYMVDGTDDEVVRKAIEDKFYEDTGERISLEVKLYSDNELTQKVDINWSKRSSDMDGVIHYISEDAGSAIKKYAAEPNTVREVPTYLEQFGSSVLEKIREGDEEHIGERSAYFPYSDGSLHMNAIPSVERESGYVMVVRKDWMKQLYDAGKISTNPEDVDVSNDNYRSMKFSEFDAYLRACKENISTVRYAIEGAPWALNWLLAGVFDGDMYNTQIDENGAYVPAAYTKENAELLNQLWVWAKEGVWENESINRTDSSRETDLLAGFTAVCCSYPDVENMITLMRKFQEANSLGELMVIAPLAKEDGTVNGNMKKLRASSGLIMPEKAGSDSEMVVKYLNWLYSDVENYELAKYGVKGVHWQDGEDYVYNGKTYKTWVYPDGKEDVFNANNPYSGMYCILDNVNVSNRMRGDYNTLEKRLYVIATQEFPMYSSNDIEGVWLPNIPRDLKSSYNKLEGTFVDKIRGDAWAGLGETSISERMAEHCVWGHTYFPDVFEFYDSSIKGSLASFNEIFSNR